MTRLSHFAVRYRVKHWPEDWLDDWHERAAIMEYDGGLSREEAEVAAYRIVVAAKTKAAVSEAS